MDIGVIFKSLEKLYAAGRVIERWHVLIPGAEGHGQELLKDIVQKISELEVPMIKLSQRQVSRKLRGGLGEKDTIETRTFVAVENKYLKGYTMHIGVRDYGKQLLVSWYLTLEAFPWWKIALILVAALVFLYGAFKISTDIGWLMVLVLPFVSIYFYRRVFGSVAHPALLGIHDLEELSAYVSSTHESVKATVQRVMSKLDLDFTKVDTKSRGFLNIS